MVRPLPRGIDVGMICWTDLEVGASVLQREATSLGDDTTAKGGIKAVDKADPVAFFVRDGEVYGIAGGLSGTGVAMRGRGRQCCG